jgi:predicted PurR-regulated permease PerM
VAGLALGVPALIDQLASFLARLPVYIMTLENFVLPEKFARNLSLQLNFDNLLKNLSMVGVRGAEVTIQALQQTLSGVAWLVNMALLVVMTPLVAFYLLVDWPSFTLSTLTQLPKRWRKTVQSIGAEIDVKMAAYLRGTLGVCLLLAIYYAVGLSLLGTVSSWLTGTSVRTLELGWAIGIMTGLLAFIPMIGATIGLGTMLAVALVQYQLQMWEPYALIIGLFFVGQFIEGNVLTPYMVGQRVGLHPLWVIFALLAGSTLGGILGMLLAIPVAVVVSVMLPRLLAQWREAID